MNTLPKKVLRQMIQENGLKNVDDFHSFLKNLIKDSIQEILEADLDIDLGHSKNDKKAKKVDNTRSSCSSIKTKSKLVLFTM